MDHRKGDSGDCFTVLSLDGGGVRGIFSAAILAGIEEHLGHSITDHFDLVVGTSTGGIIAIGLGAGIAAADIVSMFVDRMGTIFPRSSRINPLRHLVRPKYRPNGLGEVLRETFGDRLLGDSLVPLVIPSFNLGENEVHLFKTPHHARLINDWRVPVWQVAMATAAAPTYFPAFTKPDDHVRLVDGGVWANNPAMVGVVEAVSMFEEPLSRIRVLSIGTTSDPKTRSRKLDNGGLLHWVRSPSVVDVLLAGQSHGAFTQVKHLLGSGAAFRLNPVAPSSLARLDVADSRELIAKAAHESRHFYATFETVFAGHRRFAYAPLHPHTV